jgi:electron transport complex protein RnfG
MTLPQLKTPSAARMAVRTALILLIFVVIVHRPAGCRFPVDPAGDRGRRRRGKNEADREVLPRELYDNDLLNDHLPLPPSTALGTDEASTAYLARKAGQTSALVFEAVAPDGYSGKIRLLIAVAADGTLLGVRVTQHKETPGLGDYIDPRKDKNKEHPWIRQFDGLSLATVADREWRVRKDKRSLRLGRGATVTPRAVIKAVHKALHYVAENRQQLLHVKVASATHESPLPPRGGGVGGEGRS